MLSKTVSVFPAEETLLRIPGNALGGSFLVFQSLNKGTLLCFVFL